MKKLLLLFLLLVIGLAYKVCGQAHEDISLNNVKATFSSGGVFCTIDTPTPSMYPAQIYSLYEVPRGSGIKTIFSSEPWLTGLDDSNNIHGGANLYLSNSNFSYGPVATFYDPSFESRYHRVFKVTHTEIRQHMAHFSDQGYVMPDDIALWPGNGNVSNGEAAILAPFIDLNGNQIYEPALGEYPDVCGDEAVFMMLNDDHVAESYLCSHMRAEIHLLAYSFDVPPDSVLYNTTFLHFTVYNRFFVTYHDVRFSLYADPDLGCSENDRMGCDTILNSYFVYNDPNIIDAGAACLTGVIGYGRTKVAQGFTFLDHKMTSIGDGVNFNSSFDPTNCLNVRNWQDGRFANGTHITYGGNGYGGTVPIDYLYPGDPRDSTGWSELYPQGGPTIQAGDRRFCGTISIDTLRPGESRSIDMALFTAFADSTAPVLSEIGVLKQGIQAIQHLYDQGLACNSSLTDIKGIDGDKLVLYPVPANCALYLSRDLNGARYSISDIEGRSYDISVVGKQIDISGLAQGVYVLHVSDSNTSANYRFIKE